MTIKNLPYISWSRFNLFLKNKSLYNKRYIQKIETYTTKEMEFGKNFHELMEFAMPPFLSEFDAGVTELKCERQVNADIKLLSIIDRVIDDEVIEFKTGKKPWTQKMADEHGQLFFEHYALHGFNPGKAKLVWIETEEVNGIIRYTGRKEVFEVEITEEKLREWIEKLERVYYLILFHEQVMTSIVPKNDVRVIRRQTLLNEIEKLQSQVEEIDKELQEDLIAGKSVYCDFGSFYLRSSKQKVYDDTGREQLFKEAYEKIEEQKKFLKQLIGEFELSPIYTQAKEILKNLETELDREFLKEVQETKKIQFRKGK